ncbi:SDR family NAD(P)-dependent oxidoreductase [Mycobacterium sp. 94-17]|uniref:SDR family NAD(P)-dependent oxidoreductase n=1 Tax=Mycobacterium sp. 94-17 TaxID=2986147 RepID=UPI002D1F1F2C|nr:SDR family NAD(P)-dependent oxidoreductase [Mycobacterium sp. 94-17]MEB4209840.1 SDR family NAD(P)-dependent oxidoreductase [Mycobacterium sp. 94-17]
MTTALITGASTGLGREFARLCAADGTDVVTVSSGRSSDQLSQLADELRTAHGVQAHPITMDLATPGAGADLVARVDELGVDVEYLINNAGIGILGLKIHECDPAAVSQMLQLNVITLTDLTMTYAARMVAAGHGAILNVSSVAAYIVPHGLEAAYAASKAYVRSFSESVADDLRGTGVTCSHVAPGPTVTEFAATAGLADASRFNLAAMSAPVVARAGYKTMRGGRRASIPGVGTKIMSVAATVSPSKRLTALVSGYFVTRH